MKKLYKVRIKSSADVPVWAESEEEAKEIAVSDGYQDIELFDARAVSCKLMSKEEAAVEFRRCIPYGDTDDLEKKIKKKEAYCIDAYLFSTGKTPRGLPEEELKCADCCENLGVGSLDRLPEKSQWFIESFGETRWYCKKCWLKLWGEGEEVKA